MSIIVNIVSAEEEIFLGQADMVIAPAIYGEVGICQKHTPMLCFLNPGQVRLTYDNQEEEKLFYISGGFLEVQPYTVTVLADTAIRAHDLDEAAARAAEERARQQLDNRSAEIDYAHELAVIAQSTAQLNVLKRLQKKRH